MQLKRLAYNLFHRLGWEVRRNAYPSAEETLLTQFLEFTKPNTVFDIGANIGQYALMLRKCGYAGPIVSFEVQSEEYQKLTEVAARDPLWKVAPRCALGRSKGETEINVAGNSLSSSLLPMLESHLQAAPDSRYVAKDRVPIERLDALAATLLPANPRLFLKIDTQGYEEEVLIGAGSVLQQVCAMQVELSVTPLYEGAPSMRRLLELCEQLGFELHGLIPGFYEEKSGRLLQVDGLFVRAPVAR
jgi:FkbM family methyltransferase